MEYDSSRTECLQEVKRLQRTIAGQAQKRTTSKLELLRVARALEVVARRLTEREYFYSAFTSKSLLTIPERTQEFFNELSFFESLGGIWNTVCSEAHLPRNGRLLDVGCGYFPKIELGLYYFDFRGKVVLMDRSSSSLQQARSFLRFFKVPFTVETTTANFWSPGSLRYDAVVANHALDDLILDAYCQAWQVNPKTLYANEQRFRSFWHRIQRSPEILPPIVEKLSRALDRRVKTKGTILLLDYSGAQHRALKMSPIQRVVRLTQAALRAALMRRGFAPLENLMRRSFRRGTLAIKPGDLIALQR